MKLIRDNNNKSEIESKKQFGINVGKMMLGTLFAQFIGLIFYPLITRIYGPSDIGIFSLISSIVSIIVVICALRYEQAIILPDDDKDAASLVILSLIILICVFGLSILLFVGGGGFIAALMGSPVIAPYLIIVPLGLFISGTYVIFRVWGIREKKFGVQAITQSVQSGTATCLKCGIGGIISPTSWGLLIGQYVGELIGTFYLLQNILRHDFKRIFNDVSLQRIKQVAFRYKNFPLFDSGSAILEKLISFTPIFLLTYLFSTTVTGYYSLGYQMLQLPIGLVSVSIRYVFLQRAVGAKSDGTLDLVLRDILVCLILIATLPFLTLIFIGDDLFSFVFGGTWVESGIYVQIMAIWSLSLFISSTLQVMVPILEIQKFGLTFNSASLVVLIIALSIGGILDDVYLALGLMTLSGTFVNIYFINYILTRSGVKIKNVLYDSRRGLALSGILLLSVCVFWVFGVDSTILCCYVLSIVLLYMFAVLKYNETLHMYVFGK